MQRNEYITFTKLKSVTFLVRIRENNSTKKYVHKKYKRQKKTRLTWPDCWAAAAAAAAAIWAALKLPAYGL